MPRYDFRHINPLTGMPKIKEKELRDYAKFMSSQPSRSGYIWLLNNTVDMSTVGNSRYGVRVWFDVFKKEIRSDRDSTDGRPFREAKLKDGSPARAWAYEDDLRRMGWNGR